MVFRSGAVFRGVGAAETGCSAGYGQGRRRARQPGGRCGGRRCRDAVGRYDRHPRAIHDQRGECGNVAGPVHRLPDCRGQYPVQKNALRHYLAGRDPLGRRGGGHRLQRRSAQGPDGIGGGHAFGRTDEDRLDRFHFRAAGSRARPGPAWTSPSAAPIR